MNLLNKLLEESKNCINFVKELNGRCFPPFLQGTIFDEIHLSFTNNIIEFELKGGLFNVYYYCEINRSSGKRKTIG